MIELLRSSETKVEYMRTMSEQLDKAQCRVDSKMKLMLLKVKLSHNLYK